MLDYIYKNEEYKISRISEKNLDDYYYKEIFMLFINLGYDSIKEIKENIDVLIEKGKNNE